MEIVDLISESMEVRRKDFMERVGLEADEDYQVDAKTFEPITLKWALSTFDCSYNKCNILKADTFIIDN